MEWHGHVYIDMLYTSDRHRMTQRLRDLAIWGGATRRRKRIKRRKRMKRRKRRRNWRKIERLSRDTWHTMASWRSTCPTKVHLVADLDRRFVWLRFVAAWRTQWQNLSGWGANSSGDVSGDEKLLATWSFVNNALNPWVRLAQWKARGSTHVASCIKWGWLKIRHPMEPQNPMN